MFYMIATIIISVIIVILVAVVIAFMVRDGRQGKSTCSCGCSGCTMKNKCGNKPQKASREEREAGGCHKQATGEQETGDR